MGYLDFSPPQLPDLSEGVSRVGDALTAVLDRKRQERQFQAKLALDREQEARRLKQQQDQFNVQQRAADRLDARDQVKFEQDQSKYREQQRAKIMGASNPQEAEAIAAETSYYDPKTKQTVRGKLTPVGPEPTAPTAPVPPEVAARLRGKSVAPPKPTELAGPVLDAETTRENAMKSFRSQNPYDINDPTYADRAIAFADEAEKQRGGMETDLRRFNREFRGSREEQAQRDAETAAYPAQQAEHGKAMAEYNDAAAKRPYQLQFGNETPVQFDFGTQHMAGRQMAADEFAKNLPGGLSPDEVKAANLTHAAILGGLPKEQAHAYFLKEVESLRTKMSATTQESLARDRIAAVAKKRGVGGGPGRAEAYAAFQRAAADGATADDEVSKLGIKAGLKPAQVANEIMRIRTSGSRVSILGDRANALEVTDQNGKVLGKAADTKTANKLRGQIQAYDQFNERMGALLAHVKAHGDRTWSVEDMQQRDSLAAAAAAAGRVYNGLGGTDASQRLEQLINGAMGTPGHGWWTGANINVLEHVINEAAHQHQTRLNTSLKAGSPGVKPQSSGQLEKAKAWLADPKNANDPNRAGVEARIQQLEGGAK